MLPEAPLTSDPLAALSFLAAEPGDGRELRRDLERVVTLAEQSLMAAAAASVTLIRNRKPASPAWSRRLAVACDQRQYDLGDGPCLHAARHRVAVAIPDTHGEVRFGAYPGAAAELGVRSSLSLPLPLPDPFTGALNVYAVEPRALGTDALVLAHAFAAHVAVVVASSEARQLEEAMVARSVIEQAKGIIMGQRRCGPEAAFRVLVRASTRGNRKLRELAHEVVDAASSGRSHDVTRPAGDS